MRGNIRLGSTFGPAISRCKIRVIRVENFIRKITFIPSSISSREPSTGPEIVLLSSDNPRSSIAILETTTKEKTQSSWLRNAK